MDTLTIHKSPVKSQLIVASSLGLKLVEINPDSISCKNFDDIKEVAPRFQFAQPENQGTPEIK